MSRDRRGNSPTDSRLHTQDVREDVIYAASLKEQYDAIIQYGLAHRMPEN